MRSLLVEFHRFNELDYGLLRKGDSYLVAAADHPICEVKMPIGYQDYCGLMKPLRYKEGAEARAAAMKKMGDTVTTLLMSNQLKDLAEGEFPLQLDLVVNAAELAALPFEAALDQNGEPFIIRTKDPVILTRRVRGAFAEKHERWPSKARILFAWAHPEGAGAAPVPHEEHETALRQALSSLVPLEGTAGASFDLSKVLKILPNASLAALRAACAEAKEPFTHVHLLAHGYPVEEVFGLALHADTDPDELHAATPKEIADALGPLRGKAGVLSFASCDSGNASNMVYPTKSIAHELHVEGFPVVIASQFPLTVDGSTILVRTFYGEVLKGTDVREALHKARRALYDDRETTGHDWASLVGYVRLSEGYSGQLAEVRLEAELTSMKAVQAWSDDLIKSRKSDPAQFERLAGLLRESLKRLEKFSKEADVHQEEVLKENLGLLGSAEKRLAELLFECGTRCGQEGWAKPMREALERSRGWYRQGFDLNLSHHWTGVQNLSLEAVLTGKISEPGRWYAAALAAELCASADVWAWGSLAELYLLAPAAGLGDKLDQAENALREMKRRFGNDGFKMDSTERQFRRYVNWWKSAYGFFADQPDLSLQAKHLVEVIQAP